TTLINNNVMVYISNNNILSELQNSINAFHLQNTMAIDDYISYQDEDIIYRNEILNKPKGREKPDDSIKLYNYTHKEALDTLDLITQYFLQQDSDMTEYIKMISKVSQATRIARNSSLQKVNLDSFFISNSTNSNRNNEMIEKTNFMLEISEESLLSNENS
ncbi:5178_t:CDS:2, partial [Racocetra persica]